MRPSSGAVPVVVLREVAIISDYSGNMLLLDANTVILRILLGGTATLPRAG
jgi:hypothetical protein